jgi:3-oxoacyl-[acyl-carrier protein] reductase
MDDSLKGRVALVTGASSGIGKAIALAAARAGADVALTYRANEKGARAVEREISDLGRRPCVSQLDLADGNAIQALGPAVRRALGRIDIWINNAGADILTGPHAQLSRDEKLDMLLRVDLRGTMIASWQAAELLEDDGVIINMSWDHVLTGMPGTNPEMYAAVKGGVLAFSKSLARSVAPRIRVNVLAPGWIATAFSGEMEGDAHRLVAEAAPMKRWGTPEDVASAAIFLASPASGFMTGQALLIGGGTVM